VTAREEVLARIRSALADDRKSPAMAEVPRDYRRAGAARAEGAQPDLAELLVDRLVDYRASVTRAAPAEVAGVLAGRLVEHGIGSVLVPDGFPAEWLAASTAERRTDDALTPAQLDEIDGVVCTCRLAIAETGTIVLDSGAGQGRRAASLVPDYLLVVLRAEQVVAGVPEAVAELGPDGERGPQLGPGGERGPQSEPARPSEPSRPLTWISGPSATSDIELNRVEGVHGPRVLDVILIQSGC